MARPRECVWEQLFGVWLRRSKTSAHATPVIRICSTNGGAFSDGYEVELKTLLRNRVDVYRQSSASAALLSRSANRLLARRPRISPDQSNSAIRNWP
jgi:hypothetical protein